MSLVEELSQKGWAILSKKHLFVAAAILVVGGWWYRYRTDTTVTTSLETSIEYVVKKWTITIGTTADGSIQWDGSASLGFEANGRIKEIFKHPGDRVGLWEAIAKLDDAQLSIDLAKAKNSYTQAQLTYQKNIHPLSPAEQQQLEKDLEISSLSYQDQLLTLQKNILSNEQSIASAKQKLVQLEYNMSLLSWDTSLALKQTEEWQKLIQTQHELYNDLFDALQKVKDLDLQVDMFMWFSQLHHADNVAFASLISARNTSLKSTAEMSWSKVHGPSQSLTFSSFTSQDDLIRQANTLLDILVAAKDLGETMVDIMNNTVDGNWLTASQITTYKSTFSTLLSSVSQQEKAIRSSIQWLLTSALGSTSTLQSAESSLRDKKISLQQQIDSATQDLDFLMQQYELQKQQLEQTKLENVKTYEKAILDNNIKTNPLSNEEKNLYAAQVESSRLSFEEAQNNLSKATLSSPLSGVILAINWTVWEVAGSDFVTIGAQWYSYILVNISEDEIGMIQEWQHVRITPKSLSDLTLSWTVYYVAAVGVADNNGVVTFPVFISYSTTDDRVKTAMNVEVEFIRKTAQDVMIIPVKAVFPYENTPHVKLADGTMRQVITWLSDGKQVEVISWLEVGDRILITQ